MYRQKLVGVAATVIASLTAITPIPASAADEPRGARSAELSLTTPLFSVRRMPTVLSRAVADRRLGNELDQALGTPAIGNARDHACLTVAGPDGRVLYARRPDTPLIPASTLKLVVGAAALARMGPDARLTTQVRVTGTTPSGDVERLWLVGAGDPLLSTQDYAAVAGFLRQPRLSTAMEGLADRVVAAGVRTVGAVVGDDSRYDRQRFIGSWKPQYIRQFEITAISALSVNRGYLTPGPPPSPAPSPTAHAAAVLTALLRARGVTVAGDPAEGATPVEAPTVASIESPPLSAVVGDILQNSDNLGAEMLVKELGARFAGAGTTEAGLAVVRDTLPAMGVAPDGMAVVDGSGLDRSDRLTCRLLQDVLRRAGPHSPLVAGLPVAGRNGTLIRRFLATPAEGRVRAKTGSLDHVSALSGLVATLKGPALEFSLLANELPTTAAGAGLQERVVNTLVRYPDGPAPIDVAPLPPAAVLAPPAPGR